MWILMYMYLHRLICSYMYIYIYMLIYLYTCVYYMYNMYIFTDIWHVMPRRLCVNVSLYLSHCAYMHEGAWNLWILLLYIISYRLSRVRNRSSPPWHHSSPTMMKSTVVLAKSLSPSFRAGMCLTSCEIVLACECQATIILPWKHVWNLWALPLKFMEKLVRNFGSRNYMKCDLLRAWHCVMLCIWCAYDHEAHETHCICIISIILRIDVYQEDTYEVAVIGRLFEKIDLFCRI